MTNEGKSWWKSKTLWFAFFYALFMTIDGPVKHWYDSNPGLFSGFIFFIMAFLRIVTVGGVKK